MNYSHFHCLGFLVDNYGILELLPSLAECMIHTWTYTFHVSGMYLLHHLAYSSIAGQMHLEAYVSKTAKAER